MGPATCRSKQVGSLLATQLNTICWIGDQVVGFGSTAGSSPADVAGMAAIAGAGLGAAAIVAGQVGTKVAVKIAQ